eukprot:GGOE01010516.1.p1 GENE.GGOE01010516.1~~GGOE01010516.1.p1  ORF type:complete len:343 (-),score=67.08 GGOE01010516.1:1585-2613(-)
MLRVVHALQPHTGRSARWGMCCLLRHRVVIGLFGKPCAQVLSHIAYGTWSSVYHILGGEQQRYAALKVVPVGAACAESALEEVETLRKLCHPNVVQCYDHFIRPINDTRCLFVQLEYCAKGTLLDYLRAKQRRRTQLPASKVATFASQLISALKFIHAKGLLHGDIRPETILVTQDTQLKLSSFGSPLWIERHGRVARTITGGDRVYAPPEWADSVVPHRRLQQWETPLSSYDMWSLGCVVSELVTLKLLRQDRRCTAAVASNHEMLQDILTEVADAHSGIFTPLCLRLLTADATERLTAEEACRVLRRRSAEAATTTPRGARNWLTSLRRSSQCMGAAPSA